MAPVDDNVRATSNLDREGEPMTNKTLTIRRSDVADSGALARLAALDSSSALTGDALVAEVGHELWAAVEIDTGSAIADPFRPSADLVDLLRLRVEHMRRGSAGQRRRLASLLPRPRAA
jgi:hypothetical protein